jgi:undecaprenyl-diphosphatase
MGTLVAVVYYYRHIISQLLSDFYLCIVEKKTVGESKLAWGVLLGTIPVKHPVPVPMSASHR